MTVKYDDLTPRAFENAVSRLLNNEALSHNDRLAIADYALTELRRRAQTPYVQDDEAIALLRKALMTAERPDEAAMGFETDGFLADEIKAFFSRRGISGGGS